MEGGPTILISEPCSCPILEKKVNYWTAIVPSARQHQRSPISKTQMDSWKKRDRFEQNKCIVSIILLTHSIEWQVQSTTAYQSALLRTSTDVPRSIRYWATSHRRLWAASWSGHFPSWLADVNSWSSLRSSRKYLCTDLRQLIADF